jgi:hypothetical protein
LLIVCAFLLAPLNARAFTPGDVFWAAGSCDSFPCYVFDATGGGDMSGVAPFTSTAEGSFGQMTWSGDLTNAWLSDFRLDRVLEITPAGVSSVFATGLDGATGLLLLHDGRLLAASYYDGAIYDVSSGGDFSGATPFATGLGGPRNLVELGDGSILVADQLGRRVIDVTAGGDFTSDPGFAHGFPADPYDLVDDAGVVYASTFSGVYDITAGGDMGDDGPYATGHKFMGLTIDGQGSLLASVLSRDYIVNITGGGDFAGTGLWGENLSGYGDTALDTVPAALATACSDGLDNDGDGFADLDDPGCSALDDPSERSSIACDDGVDNDSDGASDFDPDPGEGDAGCTHPSDPLENPTCQNGLDDDGNGVIDFDGGISVLGAGSPDITAPDPTCFGLAWLDWEGDGLSCGLGFELVLVLPALVLVRRRLTRP